MDNNNTFVLAFKLCLICLVVGVGLALLNSVTAPRIEESLIKEKNAAMAEVLPDCEFEEVTDAVYKGVSGGETVGYTVSVVSDKGYGGNIEMIVGFKDDFTIAGIKFITMPETPGIGTKVEEEAGFVKSFLGKKDTVIVKGAPVKDNEIEGITGATISSKAVNYGVNEAERLLKEAIK